MLLLSVKRYFQQVGQASVLQIARQFAISNDLASDLIEVWIGKGKLCKLQRRPACGSRCQQCSPLHFELYQWVNDAPCK